MISSFLLSAATEKALKASAAASATANCRHREVRCNLYSRHGTAAHSPQNARAATRETVPSYYRLLTIDAADEDRARERTRAPENSKPWRPGVPPHRDPRLGSVVVIITFAATPLPLPFAAVGVVVNVCAKHAQTSDTAPRLDNPKRNAVECGIAICMLRIYTAGSCVHHVYTTRSLFNCRLSRISLHAVGGSAWRWTENN